jgi:hypothetical protein
MGNELAMASYYIATSLLNAKEHNELRNALGLRGHRITFDWTLSGFEDVSIDENRIAEIARKEIEGVLNADILVVLLPGGIGTHVELGIAIAAKKPIIIAGDEKDFLHNVTDKVFVFYCAPGITRVVCRDYDYVIPRTIMMFETIVGKIGR